MKRTLLILIMISVILGSVIFIIYKNNQNDKEEVVEIQPGNVIIVEIDNDVKLTEKEYERFKARKKAESGVEPDYFAFVYEKCSSRLEHAANQYLKQHMKFEVEG